jgi:NhaA family Na+:H+ antiporter
MSGPPSTLQSSWSDSEGLIPRVVVRPFQRFLDTETAGGVVLFVAAVVALVWANSPWSDAYSQLWSTEIAIEIGPVALHHDLRAWVNDLAMALFFFVVGLEIKREMVHGDLRDRRVAMLPVLCAFGGMAVPALLYTAVNAGAAGSGGWGIPMATDIAFSIGVLALVGRRAPAPLKALLLALAIVDDIGAIVVIAVFYSTGVSFLWLGGALAGLAVMGLLQRLRVRSLVPYVVLAGGVWFMTFESGIHATLAGVALGLLTPSRPFQPAGPARAKAREQLETGAGDDDQDDNDGEYDEAVFLDVSNLTREAVSPLARLERALHPWSAMLVLPLFALANAGVELSGLPTGDAARVTGGVALGLLVGKPVGVLLAAFIAVKVLGAALPRGVGWLEMGAMGLLAGIGFTVSLFITGLAFTGELADGAKLGILAASALAGAAGALALAARPTSNPLTSE